MNKLYSICIVFIIASCGGGGGGGGEAPAPVTPAPTVSISADPLTVLLTNTSTITWSSTYATSCTASGSWSDTKTTSGSEVVTISTPGNNTYTLSCTGAGGSRSASVTVEGYRNTDGVIVDGYIRGAEVFIDEDSDWIADSTESSTTSDNDGKFTIKYANGFLVSIGGTDLDSNTLLDNLLITHKLTGHTDFKAVTPVTSVAAFMAAPENINISLGIDADIDIYSFDPVANKGDSGVNDYLYEKGNQLTTLAYAFQNIANDLNTSTETTQDYFKAISEEVETEFASSSSKIDIETEAFITKVLDNIITAKSLTVTDEAKVNTSAALAAVMPVIEVKTSNDLTTAVIRFAASTFQTDIQSIANGSATAEIVTSYKTDILNYIATDQSVDAEKLAPNVIAVNDSGSTSEDTSLEINILSNDSYLTSAPIIVALTGPSSGSTSISSGLVTYSPNANFFGNDSFGYSITQGDKSSSASVSISVSSVNDEPLINTSSTLSADENQTSVTTVSISDVDSDTLTLSLSGTDEASFNLSSENILSFVTAPDFETKSSYSIILSLTDGTVTITKDITINIVDINEGPPVFTSSASFDAAENQTAIGTITATDADGHALTFSLSGVDANLLALSSDNVLSFKEAPDFEIKSSYLAKITASDGFVDVVQALTISVTDVDENSSPVFTSSASFNAAENQTAIGTVTTTDAESDSIIYSIAGADANSLAISSSGVLTFINAPDFETKSSYTSSLNADDGTSTSTQNITVTITNVNDNNPVINSSSSFSANENQTSAGSIDASDGDDDSLTYSLSGTDASSLTISSSGVLTFNTSPDFETKTSYAASVNVSDGTNSVSQNITISVTNLNDNSPRILSSSSFSADENQTAIGSISSSDADDDSLTYSLSGQDASSLAISSSGVLTFGSAPDYETKTSYSAIVTVSDGTNIISQGFTISINNLNDNSPVISSETSFSADENQTSIGSVSAADADGDSLTYSLSGTDASSLAISSSGVLTFGSAPDYETKSSYSFSVTVTDGTNSTSQDITISINDKNDNVPRITSAAIFTANENQTSVGTVTATDADSSSLTYGLSGADASSLAISSSGVLTFGSAPDYETKTSYSINVDVSDETETTTQAATINITNLNDNNPAISSGASFSSNENQTSIGSVSASDADGDSLTYSLSGTDASSLAISSSGVLTFGSAPDYETKTSYSATASITDGSNAVTQNLTITVINLNDNNPAISSSATFSAAENQTAIGSISASDADGDSLTYSLSGTDATSLAISSSGVLTFGSAPDYETKTSYSATASVTDGTNTSSQSITVNVTDITDTYKISGTAYASRYMVLDSDVPNTTNHPSSSNAYGSAQVIQNPTIVVGHTGNDTDKDGNNTTDAYDLYQVTLTNNMYINLEVSEYEEGVKDLNLYLFNTNGSEYTDWNYATGSTEGNETIDLPSSGTFLIQINPVNGSSRYKLTVGQRVIPSSLETSQQTEHAFIPNQFIKTERSSSNKSLDSNSRNIERKKVLSEFDAIDPKQIGKGWVDDILIEFDINKAREVQDIKDIDTKDKRLVISEKQKEYLYHWKLIQKLESKYPELDFGFNYPVFSFANFSKDPDYWVQWHFPAISAEAGLNAVGQETKNIVVAVLDTGSPPTNSAAWAATDFIAGGIDFVSNDFDPTDPDSFANYNDPETGRLVRSHGTHVASTIGSKNDGNYINGFGIKVLPIKVLGDSVVAGGTFASIINGINYAAGLYAINGETVSTSEGPVKVINMSLGGPATSCPSNLQTAINNAVAQGITVVAASGNDAQKNPGGSNVPALCDNVISVANVTEEFARRLDSDYNATVDIAAPGNNIYAWDRFSRIKKMGGTSMAAPIVSGVIANMYSLDSGLTPAEINTYITAGSFSYDLGDAGRDNQFGYGLINFAKAANSVITEEGLSKTYAYVNPGLIDYGFSTTSINIVLNKVGSGTLSVSNVTADNATGISYNSSIDGNGFGTYALNFDRSDYPNGAYGNMIYFNMSDGTSAPVAMRYAKGSQPDRANLGKIYIGLYNSSNNIVASGTLSLDESLAFETTGNVAIGNYYYIISTDIDNDGYICNSGEICEIYPLSDSSDLYISVTNEDVTGDAITLKAISGGASSLSSFSEGFTQPLINGGKFKIPGNVSKKINALDKPVEVKSLFDFSGTPVQEN